MIRSVQARNSKVCFLTSVHSPFDPRIFYKEARSLVEAGYQVTIVAPHPNDEDREGIRVKAVSPPHSRIERVLITTWKAFGAGVSQKADVYHFHDPELLVAGLALKLLGNKVIYDVHEDLPKTFASKHYIPRVFRRSMARMANFIEKIAARCFDAIVPATDDIAKQFRKLSRIATVKNYPRFSDLVEAHELGARNRSFRCVYVGALSKPRGISKIVEAMSMLEDLNDVELVLCGVFSPAAYEKEVRQLGGFSRTRYHGWMEPSAVPRFLPTVDVGLVCIQPEDQYLASVPTKLFEYMLAGIPVITSNFPLWRQIVEGNQCGLCVDPLEPSEIASVIRYMHSRPAIRTEMGKNGRRAVLDEFNWESQSKVLLTLYDKILDGHVNTGALSAKQTICGS